MAIKTESNEKSSDENSAIVDVARKRFALVDEVENDFRTNALNDLEFLAGNQWPDAIKQARQLEQRPTLTMNRLPQYKNQITNDQRQNRPAIKVSPVDDKGDVETAKIFQGIIRHIEYNSNADIAYDRGFEGTVSTGRGFFRFVTEYVSPTSFDQEILVKSIRNHLSVGFDPASKEPDGSDANWAFVYEDVDKSDYEAAHPDTELSRSSDWESLGTRAPGWISSNSVRVAEYFYKEYKQTTVYLMSDGSSVEKEEMERRVLAGERVLKERVSSVPKIIWCKLNGIEILEKTEWPGKWIPIVPIYGSEIDIDGKVMYEGIIRNAKDPQRMYNYMVSMETEAIALAPKAPYIIAEGQLEGYEHIWKSANTQNHAYLPYKTQDIMGNPVPPPQRNTYEPAVAALTNARLQFADDIKATTGLYDAAMGRQSNETSGKAIQRRAAQAQTANFHFIDNLSRSMRHGGRILVDLIPKIYDSARAVQIIGEDGEKELIWVNKLFTHKGQEKMYQLDVGKYDVTISVGPSYATKRQEAVEAMLEFIRVYPSAAQILGDLLAKNMDWPGAEEIAERLRKTVPPGIIDDKNKAPVPPEAQAQMAQMDQMIAQLTEKLNQANEEMRTKKMELESKERIEFAKMELDATKELTKLQSAEAMNVLKLQIAEFQRRQNLVDINQPIETEAENGAGSQGAAMPNQPQEQQPFPTGGPSPGIPVE